MSQKTKLIVAFTPSVALAIAGCAQAQAPVNAPVAAPRAATPVAAIAPLPSPEAANPNLQVKVVPDRLIYKPGQGGTIAVQFANTSPAAQGVVTLVANSGLGVSTTLGEKRFTLGEGEKKTLDFAFAGLPDQAGVEFVARFTPDFTNAAKRAAAREYSLVARNPVGMSQLYFSGGVVMSDAWKVPQSTIEKQYRNAVRDTARAMYCGVWEQTYWAPDDFADLTPTAETWRSGQNFLFVHKGALQTTLDEVQRQGMTSLFYANTFSFGPVGFDFARRHPDWYTWKTAWYGGIFNSKELEFWNLPEALRPERDGFPHSYDPVPIMALTPLITKPEVAKFHRDEVIASIKMFDWDGIRYDNNGWNVWEDIATDPFGKRVIPAGTTRAQMDEMATELVKTARSEWEKQKPGFVYGDNAEGFPPGRDLKTAPKRWLAKAANGGLVMEEAFSSHVLKGGKPWEEVEQYLDGARGIRQAGGYPYLIGPIFVNSANDSIADTKTAVALSTAAGSLLCASGSLEEKLYPYLRHLMRYAELFYDDNVKPVANWSSLVSIKAPRRLLSRHAVNRRTLADGRTQFIVHLINRSENDSFTTLRANDKADPNAGPRAPFEDPKGKFALSPLVQSNISVSLKVPANMKISRAYAISADSDEPRHTALPLKIQGGQASVVVPRLDYWTTVVLEGGKS